MSRWAISFALGTSPSLGCLPIGGWRLVGERSHLLSASYGRAGASWIPLVALSYILGVEATEGVFWTASGGGAGRLVMEGVH